MFIERREENLIGSRAPLMDNKSFVFPGLPTGSLLEVNNRRNNVNSPQLTVELSDPQEEGKGTAFVIMKCGRDLLCRQTEKKVNRDKKVAGSPSPTL